MSNTHLEPPYFSQMHDDCSIISCSTNGFCAELNKTTRPTSATRNFARKWKNSGTYVWNQSYEEKEGGIKIGRGWLGCLSAPIELCSTKPGHSSGPVLRPALYLPRKKVTSVLTKTWTEQERRHSEIILESVLLRDYFSRTNAQIVSPLSLA